MGRLLFLLFIILLAGCLLIIYYHYNLASYFTFESVKYNRQLIDNWYQAHKIQFILIFILGYTLSCCFIIPLLYLLLNIVAGFIFGITGGLIIVSIVNCYTTIITFLAARFLFRHFIEVKFSKLLIKVNNQLNVNGWLYIIFIRAFPIMPFIVSNSIMGLTRINIWVYLILSQISIIPELLLTLYIGQKLDNINSLQEILNAKSYLFTFAVLALIIICYWGLNKKFNKKHITGKKPLL